MFRKNYLGSDKNIDRSIFYQHQFENSSPISTEKKSILWYIKISILFTWHSKAVVETVPHGFIAEYSGKSHVECFFLCRKNPRHRWYLYLPKNFLKFWAHYFTWRSKYSYDSKPIKLFFILSLNFQKNLWLGQMLVLRLIFKFEVKFCQKHQTIFRSRGYFR